MDIGRQREAREGYKLGQVLVIQKQNSQALGPMAS